MPRVVLCDEGIQFTRNGEGEDETSVELELEEKSRAGDLNHAVTSGEIMRFGLRTAGAQRRSKLGSI